MSVFGIGHRLVSVSIALTCATCLVLAQKGGATASSPSRSPTTSPSPSPVNTPNNNPTNLPSDRNSTGLPGSPVFLSGRVLFDDGSAMNPNVRIERICGASVRLEAHVDGKGHFSFQVGQNAGVDVDASMDSSAMRLPGSNSSLNNVSGDSRGAFGSQTDLGACELRASYPGYRSDSINLVGHRSLDNPDVGVIILHRLANVQGTTMSATTLEAPKHAQKAYEKGLLLASKGKFDEARQHLMEATSNYPKYALAWFALGQIEQKQGRFDDARKAYEAAISADSRYVSPYDQIAFIAAQQKKWEDAADFSQRAVNLNPVEFPTSLWYNAIANYNLKKPAEAEKSAKQLLQVDTLHQFPGVEKLLAQLLLDKGDLTDAAAHMRAYLADSPNASDAGPMKELLGKVEQASSQPKQ